MGSGPKLIGDRAQACLGGAWGQSRRGTEGLDHQGPQHSPLASSHVCPIHPERTCQPDGGKQSHSYKSQGLRSCPSQASRGLGPLPAPASRLGLPGELTPTRSLSLAPEQSKLCMQGWHCSLRPPRANTSRSPRHSQAPQPWRDLVWGWALCAMRGHPVPPDFSRDPVWSPECILPQARARKAENECFPAQVART